MTTFDARERAFEAKLAHDEELKFRANVRRNKRLGLWAAEKLGKTEAETEDYVAGLIAADLEENNEEEIFKMIRADFDKAGVQQSDHQIRRTMDEFRAAAIKEIMTVVAEAKEHPHGH